MRLHVKIEPDIPIKALLQKLIILRDTNMEATT